MPAKQYYVLAEGWLEDAYRLVGSTVTLTEKQAEYLVRAGIIGTESPKAEKAKKSDQ